MDMPRRNAATVKRGRPGKKQNWRYTPGAERLAGTNVIFERQRPGRGYRHVLRKADIERFIALLPDWEELSRGLEAIVLLPGQDDLEGLYGEGWIGICAWSRTLWHAYDERYFEHPRESITRVGVPFERYEEGWIGKWTQDSIRAYQLLDVLVHELGHHHDRMTTRSQRHPARGERYAEEYATPYADRIWQAYCTEFDFVVSPTDS